MLIKVYDGTISNGGRSLCETCRNATITRGAKLEDEIVRCEAQPMTTPVLIRFKVTECSAYLDARLPTVRATARTGVDSQADERTASGRLRAQQRPA